MPLLIGTNKDENALFLAYEEGAGILDEKELVKRLQPMLGDRAEAVIAVHHKNRPQETPWDLFVSILSEDRRLLSITIAEEKEKQGGAPVYLYFFTWESNHGLLKAAHTMEIPFVFRTLDATSIVGTRDDREVLADIMSDTWIAFARNGNQDNPAIPKWKPYNTKERATMIFDVPPRMEKDPRREERLAWEGISLRLPWED